MTRVLTTLLEILGVPWMIYQIFVVRPDNLFPVRPRCCGVHYKLVRSDDVLVERQSWLEDCTDPFLSGCWLDRAQVCILGGSACHLFADERFRFFASGKMNGIRRVCIVKDLCYDCDVEVVGRFFNYVLGLHRWI